MLYEPNSENIFPGLATPIKGGIAITYHDSTKRFEPIGTFTATSEIETMLQKVLNHPEFSSFSDIVVTRTAYHFTEIMHRENPDAVNLLSKGHSYDVSTNVFDRLPHIFFDEKPNDNKDYIQILGRINNVRCLKYVRRDYIVPVANLDFYKLMMPSANGSGRFGETLTTPIIGEPAVGSTETFISIGKFRTKKEAINAEKYVDSKFCRTLLGILKVTQHLTPDTFRNVPLQSFTSSSDIDWTKSVSDIDKQLYKKYKLTKEEIDFIETHVKEMN
jgi:hypothetical protein